MKKLMVLFALFLAVASVSALPVIRYIEFKIYDPVYVAIEKGFFEREGIEVKLHGSVLAGANSVQAVAGGSAEAGMTSMFALTNAVGAGVGVIGIADIQSVLKNQPLERFFVRKDSGITKVEQMAGKTWAVNLLKSSFHYTVIMHMDKIGMDIESFKLVVLPFPQQIQAISQKQVDMVSLMEPYATVLDQMGGYREVFTALDTFGEKQMSAIFVNRKWAKTNPDLAMAFNTGIAKATAWIEKNPAESSAIIAKYLDLKPEQVPAYHFTKNGKMIEKDSLFWIDFLYKRGDLKTRIAPSDVVTNKYNRLEK